MVYNCAFIFSLLLHLCFIFPLILKYTTQLLCVGTFSKTSRCIMIISMDILGYFLRIYIFLQMNILYIHRMTLIIFLLLIYIAYVIQISRKRKRLVNGSVDGLIIISLLHYSSIKLGTILTEGRYRHMCAHLYVLCICIYMCIYVHNYMYLCMHMYVYIKEIVQPFELLLVFISHW